MPPGGALTGRAAAALRVRFENRETGSAAPGDTAEFGLEKESEVVEKDAGAVVIAGVSQLSEPNLLAEDVDGSNLTSPAPFAVDAANQLIDVGTEGGKSVNENVCQWMVSRPPVHSDILPR